MRLASALQINVRPLQIQDQDKLRQLVDTICAERRWMHTVRYTPTLEWEHAFTHPNCTCHLLLICQSGACLVGWCRVFPVGDRAGEVGLGLLPAYRDQGLGTKLVLQAVDWAARAGFERVLAKVLPGNKRSLHVFQKCGFQTASKTQNEMEEFERKLIFLEAAQPRQAWSYVSAGLPRQTRDLHF